MKLQAKRNIRSFKRLRIETGGGNPPAPPDEIDYRVADLIPHELTEDGNKFDNDAVHAEISVFKIRLSSYCV